MEHIVTNGNKQKIKLRLDDGLNFIFHWRFSGRLSLKHHNVDENWYSRQHVKVLTNELEFEMNQLENLNKFELLNK